MRLHKIITRLEQNCYHCNGYSMGFHCLTDKNVTCGPCLTQTRASMFDIIWWTIIARHKITARLKPKADFGGNHLSTLFVIQQPFSVSYIFLVALKRTVSDNLALCILLS